jgi:hypothetical protein
MKKTTSILRTLGFAFMALWLCSASECNTEATTQSGIKKAQVKAETDLNGNTIEQLNIMEKIKRDNMVGTIRHLYIISSYTGEVFEYSAVKGKITSGAKRLSPKIANGGEGNGTFRVGNFGGTNVYSDEILSDDGTYGESANYLYWFDTKGNYHQYFPTGGTYIHISDAPLTIQKSSFTFKQ